MIFGQQLGLSAKSDTFVGWCTSIGEWVVTSRSLLEGDHVRKTEYRSRRGAIWRDRPGRHGAKPRSERSRPWQQRGCVEPGTGVGGPIRSEERGPGDHGNEVAGGFRQYAAKTATDIDDDQGG